MKLAFYTLGCKVNQFETQALELLFSERGHVRAEGGEEPDAVIVNTCTVTAVSDKKSRQLIRRMRREHPRAVLAVCGCFPQVNPEGARAIDGVDVVAGTGDRTKLAELVERAFSDRTGRQLLDDALRREEYELLPAGGLSGHTRAMLKVQTAAPISARIASSRLRAGRPAPCRSRPRSGMRANSGTRGTGRSC